MELRLRLNYMNLPAKSDKRLIDFGAKTSLSKAGQRLKTGEQAVVTASAVYVSLAVGQSIVVARHEE